MNLTSHYRAITQPAKSHQKLTHIEHVPASTYLKDKEETEHQKLKRLFPALEEAEAEQQSSEPTVYIDERPLIDELV